MTAVGYARLAQHTEIKAKRPAIVAEVRPVSRLDTAPGIIMVPSRMAPDKDDVYGHIMFALKHEGINLQILSQALPLVPESLLREEFDNSPNSQYLRRACFLWEHFTGETIHRRQQKLAQNYTRLFNPKLYFTGSERRDERWRVTFNGIGSMAYCATVRRTPLLEAQLAKDLLRKAAKFTESLPRDILNRTLSWAYLSETQDSFAIEKEAVNADKSRRFVEVLKQAHEGIVINEDSLTDLQNIAIDNPFIKATSYRNEQNYLGTAQTGPLGVTYIPPDHVLARELMDELCNLANDPPEDVDPIILGAVVSFGFVFIHPFMDGNGRLSRFLFHQLLCKTGGLVNGLVLPVSTVMHQNESDYLDALKSFSEGTAQFWNIEWMGDVELDFDFRGHSAIYRYWDATQCCEFMALCAETAIEKHLKEETVFLNRYDQIYRTINERFDVVSKDLGNLVMMCMQHHGRLSNHRRKQYQYRVPEEVFDALEKAYRDVIDEVTTVADPAP